jgi:predicted acetyltransferase
VSVVYTMLRKGGLVIFKCGKCGYVVIARSERHGRAMIESHIRDVHNLRLDSSGRHAGYGVVRNERGKKPI